MPGISLRNKMTKVNIKENSWLARIAACKLKSSSVAMVVGRTIYLHNSSKKDFLNNERWVRHEVAHVKQYLQLGLLRFLALYLLETFNKGYENNRFEVEARQKEKDISILSEVHFK
jgi:hypothetical protein